MFCSRCGKEIGEESAFCKYCGNKIETGDISGKRINKTDQSKPSTFTENKKQGLNYVDKLSQSKKERYALLVTIIMFILTFAPFYPVVKAKTKWKQHQ